MSSTNLSYQTVADVEYQFLNDQGDWGVAMRHAVEKLGRGKIIFVEGYDDKIVFKTLYEAHLEAHLSAISFLDVSLGGPSDGGCEHVKSLLIDFVRFLPQEKRFYGVIDRDLKTDQEIYAERNKDCYEGRLFIFFERYTLENYFTDLDVLKKFIQGQSIKHQGLRQLVDEDAKLREIIDDIISCSAKIAAANLTIRFFDNTVEFVEVTIDCGDDEIEKRVHHRLKDKCEDYVEAFVNAKFQLMKEFIMQSYPENVQKFASAKKYFATQFNKRLKADYDVGLQLNNHKDLLAGILKAHPPLPNDFNELLRFLGVIS